MDNIDFSSDSLIRGYGNLIHHDIMNTHAEPYHIHDQSAEVESLSKSDIDLAEIAIIGAMSLLEPDMTFDELNQSIAGFR